jgi:hypothetical protein
MEPTALRLTMLQGYGRDEGKNVARIDSEAMQSLDFQRRINWK